MYVRKPTRRNGRWIVAITETISPISKQIETITCISREAAYQTYRRLRKEQGKGL